MSFCFCAGGSEFEPKKSEVKEGLFGGGSGAGVSISPLGFLVVSPIGDVKMVPVTSGDGAGIDRIIQSVPDAVDKISDYFKKRKEKKMDE